MVQMRKDREKNVNQDPICSSTEMLLQMTATKLEDQKMTLLPQVGHRKKNGSLEMGGTPNKPSYKNGFMSKQTL